MKRIALALLVHPYKNRLLLRSDLKNAVDTCIKKFVALLKQYPTLRFNIVLPGYILEQIDSLALSELREIQKHGTLEWLACGYTEPFLSFCTPAMACANIRNGIETMAQLLDCKPSGYVPPFSNWEPVYLETFHELGLNYAVVSHLLFQGENRLRCGCWATEHLGFTSVLFPSHTFHYHNAPANIRTWLDEIVDQDPDGGDGIKIAAAHYLLPLEEQAETDSFSWLRTSADILDKMVLKYQTVCFSGFLGDNDSLGLHYLPPSLSVDDASGRSPYLFRNWLFTYEQIGILNRKMMELGEALAVLPSSRQRDLLLRQFFFVQDINRYLPGRQSGFSELVDRFWCFRKMIDIEKKIPDETRPRGGQVRIADCLRNGSKSIIMSNRALKVYIDHHNGGSIYELDFIDRGANCASLYTPDPHPLPCIMVPGRSKTAFTDHFIPAETTPADFLGGGHADLGDFHDGRFEYKVKKTPDDVKAVLTRYGALLQGDKNCPLTMEKVFALEHDNPEISFVYQLSNNSLTPYRFTFAVDLAFALPGAITRRARLVCEKNIYKNLAWERIYLDNVTNLALEDHHTGIRIELKIPKPANVLCYPVGKSSRRNPVYQGTVLVISHPVQLEPNNAWTLMGKLIFKKVRGKWEYDDAL